jgi:hypothetical protein
MARRHDVVDRAHQREGVRAGLLRKVIPPIGHRNRKAPEREK